MPMSEKQKKTKKTKSNPALGGNFKYDAQINKEGYYTLTAFVSGKEERVKGNTLQECFEKLIASDVVKGKCILSVQKGDLKSTLQLSPMKVKRLYFNKVYREILSKQLNLLLT